jgi:enoyl-CoA hydratase/carnithine racemase
MTEGTQFEVEERGEITILNIGQRARGLPLSEPEDMKRVWSILHRVAASKQKVFLVVFSKNVFASERIDEAWDDIRRKKSSGHQRPPQILAIQNNVKKLIDFFQHSQVLTIGAFSGRFDLDLFGLLAMTNYRICTTDSIIENQTLDRLAPPGGATVWFLSRLLGIASTSEIYLNAQSLTAPEARDLKLVNAIAPSDALQSFAEQKADYFASKSKLALRTLTIALNNTHLTLPDYLAEIGTGFESEYIED